jgi:glycosyltransferase involved in cell wall biosynthesis
MIANARIPSERAHPMQIMHMAAAFASNGAQVTLAYARRANTVAMRKVSDPFEYANVARSFRLVGLPTIDAIKRVTLDWPLFNVTPIRLVAHFLQLWTFTVTAALMAKRWQADIVLSRDLLPLTVLQFITRRQVSFAFEAHTVPRSRLSSALHRWAVRRMDGVVTITAGLRQWYLDSGFDPSRVLVAADGVDVAAFDRIDQVTSRQDLDLPEEAPIACYIGHLYPWKGVDVLVRAADHMDQSVHWYIVGGVSPDLERIRSAASGHNNVHVTGHLSPSLARKYLLAADIAVIPFSAREEIARSYTSPLKLFEYMAAQRPIVASDLPSLREILRDGENALLVTPDDPEALADAVNRLLNDHVLARALVQVARAEVEEMTWANRAKRILMFLGSDQLAS